LPSAATITADRPTAIGVAVMIDALPGRWTGSRRPALLHGGGAPADQLDGAVHASVATSRASAWATSRLFGDALGGAVAAAILLGLDLEAGGEGAGGGAKMPAQQWISMGAARSRCTKLMTLSASERSGNHHWPMQFDVIDRHLQVQIAAEALEGGEGVVGAEQLDHEGRNWRDELSGSGQSRSRSTWGQTSVGLATNGIGMVSLRLSSCIHLGLERSEAFEELGLSGGGESGIMSGAGPGGGGEEVEGFVNVETGETRGFVEGGRLVGGLDTGLQLVGHSGARPKQMMAASSRASNWR